MRVVPPVDLASPQPVQIVVSRELLAVWVDQVAEELVVPKSGRTDPPDLRLLGEVGLADFVHHDACLGKQLSGRVQKGPVGALRKVGVEVWW